MTKLLNSAAIATVLFFGAQGVALAQGVNPGQPGSAAGGMQAQSTQQGQSQGQQAGSQMQAMSEQQVRTALQARGYSEIEGLERNDGTFRVSEAKRYGETVEDLRVDARTGMVRDEKRLSTDQAEAMLKDRGYSDVSDVERDGDTITANAEQAGNKVKLRIDAKSGMVSRQQEG